MFSTDDDRIKKNKTDLFDVTMGCYDGAEVCELVGTDALGSLPQMIHKREKASDYTETTA